jgi:DNA replication initiation complex subunit (GINS family)
MKADNNTYIAFRTIQQREEKSPILAKIEQRFYFKLSELQKRPGNMSEEEIQNIEKIFMGICELREKKIVQAALSKARGGISDLKNMLDVERKLFDSIVDILLQSRKRFFNEETEVITKNFMI